MVGDTFDAATLIGQLEYVDIDHIHCCDLQDS